MLYRFLAKIKIMNKRPICFRLLCIIRGEKHRKISNIRAWPNVMYCTSVRKKLGNKETRGKLDSAAKVVHTRRAGTVELTQVNPFVWLAENGAITCI